MLSKNKITIDKNDRKDVKAGRIEYGQMIQLGRLLDAVNKDFEDKKAEVKLIKDLIGVLHPDIEVNITYDNVDYAIQIAEGVTFWRKQEAELLKNEATDDEKAAGCERLAKITGASGVAATIAEKFGVSGGIDEVLRWPYASVFMVLYIDLERYKYQKRLNKIREMKSRKKVKK